MPRPADISPSPLWLTPVAIAAAIVMGNIYGRGPFFITLAACALCGAIWLLWRSLQSLTGEAPLTLDEALGLGAPNAEEERKASVLRALKDLEYERSVGKIDDDDFIELSEKYRAEARLLLQLVDENLGPARRDVIASLDERIARELGAEQKVTATAASDSATPAGNDSAAPKNDATTPAETPPTDATQSDDTSADAKSNRPQASPQDPTNG